MQNTLKLSKTKSNIELKNKIYSSFKNWKKDTSKIKEPELPKFFQNSIGKHKYFSIQPNPGELFKIKLTYDEINPKTKILTSTLSLMSIINEIEDTYIFSITVNLDANNYWKPKANGFNVKIHETNSHDFASDILTYLKSPSSEFKGNIRKYLYGNKIINSQEKHKNLLGCIIKNGFSQFYSAATHLKKEENNG